MRNDERMARRTIRIARVLTLMLVVLAAAATFMAEDASANDAAAAARPKRPNVLLIITDNHAAWQLGCYGNADIYSPNIDALARRGIRFTQAMSVSPVCSPTRASIFTGLIPSQHGLHHWLFDGDKQVGPNAQSQIAEFTTLPEVLAENGYYCGLVGKWHLGDNATPQEGYSYWVAKTSGLTKNFYDNEVVVNGEIVQYKKYITPFWTEHAVKFLEIARQRQEQWDEPFFLTVTYNGPYSLDAGMLLDEQKSGNAFSEMYANKDMKSFPRLDPHPDVFKHTLELNDVRAMRAVGAQITAVDYGIGEIMDTLRRLGLADDTLVIFTADQGTAGGHNGVWGMGHNTFPGVAYDAILRVPLIIMPPKSDAESRQCDFLVNNYDLMPTVLDFLDLGDQNPANSPGRSYAGVLRDEQIDWEQVTFYEHFYLRAIRTDRWKYVYRHHHADDLYDLVNDPQETANLAEDPKHAATVAELRGRMESFFSTYADAQYDTLRGGGTKSWRPPFVEPDFVAEKGKAKQYQLYDTYEAKKK